MEPFGIRTKGSPVKDLSKVVCDEGFALSRAEARRQISQGAIHVNGKRVDDPQAKIANNATVTHQRRRGTDLDPESDLSRI